jgi:hypothetical protein
MTLQRLLATLTLCAVVAAGVSRFVRAEEDNRVDATATWEKEIDVQTAKIEEVAEAQAAAAMEQAAAKMKAAADQSAQTLKFKFRPTPTIIRLGMPDLSQAAEKVRDAKDEASKAEATAELTRLVEKHFEEDMQIREKELESIAARVEKLKAQLARRREKKQDIVDLQVKVVINDADGLGFTSRPTDDLMLPQPWAGPPRISPSECQ